MKYIKLSLFVCCIIFSNFTAKAQLDNVGAELLKPFKAQLAESRKQTSTPLLPPLDTSLGNLKYFVPEHIVTVNYPEPTIRPLAMPTPKTPEAKTFYAKAGFGYPISPLVELSYQNKQNKNFRFGTNFKHHSGQGNVDFQNFGETDFDLGGTYFMNNGLAFGAKLGINLDAYNFYGFNKLRDIQPDSLDIFPDSIDLERDSFNQRFFEFFANVHLFNAKSNAAQLNYGADIDVGVLSDRYGASEFILAPRLSVEKWLGNYNNKHRLGADLYVNLASYSYDSLSSSRLLLNFRPGIDLNFGTFKATLATNLGLNEGNFFIFPDVQAKMAFADGMFDIYAGWKGEMRTNTFRSFSAYNQFISSALDLRHTSHNEFYGGITGNIRGIGYDFKAGYALTRNMPLFINDSTQNFLRFNVIYDTLSVINFEGGLDFKIIKDLTLLAVLRYNIYTGGTFDKAYHLPVLESNFSLQYELQSLLLRSEIYFNAGVPHIDVLTNESATLGGLFDINFHASYWFGKKDKQNVALFADINNILNNKNQRWYLYPQIGFNVMGGVIVKF